MALAPDFCKICFNWVSAQDDVTTTLSQINVIRHTYLDIGLTTDYEQYCYEDGVQRENGQVLKFVRPSELDSFVCNIICNDPGCGQINGISIESESKTLEFNSCLDGYIKTVRGKSIRHSESVNQNSENSIFVCSATFDDPCSDLSIKFLSLGNKETISIRSISINMQRHNLHHKGPGTGSNFGLSRLKKDLEGMGNAAPAGAFGLLQAMETFEKNKMNSLGSILSAGCFNSSASNKSAELKKGLPPEMATIMQCVLGNNALQNLEKNLFTTSHTGTESSTNGHTFNMLQAVCGKVTEARASKTESKDIPTNNEQQRNEIESNKSSNGELNQMESYSILLSHLDQRLEEAKTDMREEIQKVKQEVMHQIESMKQEVNGQLNEILNLLHTIALSSQNVS